MKKLFYLSVFILGISTPNFAKQIASNTAQKQILEQEKEYKKISPDQVNKEALINLKAKYGDYQVSEAAVSSDGEYKLVLKKDNGILTAIFTSTGELVKIL
ncbi:hypothetical protein [uncultured Flavobacterium sp.]|uniref:hypothetical protein n=1 Tax=uncultured Flavobacterium sp. TaxID=165435 RepID=UPI0025D97F7F|nr:hypothetical protein [uncultured Flavobacterium sp.]